MLLLVLTGQAVYGLGADRQRAAQH